MANALPPNAPRPYWITVLVAALGFLMVTVDSTLISIALPQAQLALGLTDTDRQWLVTVYMLTAGALLLLGGRMVDAFGAPRMFLVGAAGFAVMSALAGLAQNGMVLIACRAVQGAFGAVLAPAALATVAAVAQDPLRRARAFAIYGTVSAVGGPAGMVLGGALVQFASWRVCLFFNLALGLLVWLAAWRVFPRQLPTRATGERQHYDVLGALLATSGLGLLLYAVARLGKGGTPVDALLAGLSVALLVAFVVIEKRLPHSMLPRCLFDNPMHRMTLAILFLMGGSFMGVAILMSFFIQRVFAFAPALTGLALLPATTGIMVGAALTARLVPALGARQTLAAGAGCTTLGLALLTQLTADSSYWAVFLPGDLLTGLGMGLTMMPAANLLLDQVPARDQGAMSAMNTATMKVAAAVCATVFNAMFVAFSEPAGAAGAAVSTRPYQVAVLAALVAAGTALALALWAVPMARRQARLRQQQQQPA